ncbi:hypothetical protein [Pseudoalteromonas luteoviolacea]|nr:hypothetical protein [Pseudoalteromonas luteoviolacea]
MRFKLYYGVSVFNVLLIVLAAIYGILTKSHFVSFIDLNMARHMLIAGAVVAPMLWLGLAYSTRCPHCNGKALPFFNQISKKPQLSEPIPKLLRPFSFMVEAEFFANYCYCIECNEKIIFKKGSHLSNSEQSNVDS